MRQPIRVILFAEPNVVQVAEFPAPIKLASAHVASWFPRAMLHWYSRFSRRNTQ